MTSFTKALKHFLLAFCMLSGCPAFLHAQLSLFDCYRKAQANYPLIKQYEIIEKTKEYSLSNANKAYLPRLLFSAKASYQSDVTKLPSELTRMVPPGVEIPELSKDQYGANIELSQSIWDGGLTASRKAGIRAAAEVEEKTIQVNLYALNERVNQVFFGILLSEAQWDQNRIWQEDLKKNYDRVASYVDNGIANESDLDAIRIEQLKARQLCIRLENTKKAYLKILSTLIGEELDADTRLIKPEALRPVNDTILRPELALYQAQIRNFEAQKRSINATLMPQLHLFATGGYGRPGLDMLDDDFTPYYVVGAKLQWNIGGFYTQKNSKRQIAEKIRSIEVRRETFLFNTRMDVIQKNNTIDSYTDQLQYDDRIIELRTAVKRASEAKMANGVLSGTELIRDIHAEQMAINDKLLHEMELLLAIYNLKFATNN